MGHHAHGSSHRSGLGDEADYVEAAANKHGELNCGMFVAFRFMRARQRETAARKARREAANVRRLARRSALDRGFPPNVECRRWFQLLGLRLALDQADILLNA